MFNVIWLDRECKSIKRLYQRAKSCKILIKGSDQNWVDLMDDPGRSKGKLNLILFGFDTILSIYQFNPDIISQDLI